MSSRHYTQLLNHSHHTKKYLSHSLSIADTDKDEVSHERRIAQFRNQDADDEEVKIQSTSLLNIQSIDAPNQIHSADEALSFSIGYNGGKYNKKQSITSTISSKREIPRGIIGSLIAFNNQSSILMNSVSKAGDIMLMHETRIFYFRSKKNYRAQSDDDQKYQDSSFMDRISNFWHNLCGDDMDIDKHKDDPDLKKHTDDIRIQLIGMYSY